MDLGHFLSGGLPILIGLIFVATFTAVTLLLTMKSDDLTVSPRRQLKRPSLRREDDPDRVLVMIAEGPAPAGTPPHHSVAPEGAERIS